MTVPRRGASGEAARGGPTAVDLRGRTAVVTGATGGLGRHLVRRLAASGATTIAVGRIPDRVDRLVADLRHEPGTIIGDVVDLASSAQVRALADRIVEHGPVHVLVNNAGAIYGSRRVDPAGVERHVAVDHLGPFLLTTLLLPSLRAGAPSAVVNLSTMSVSSGDLTDLQSERRFDPNRAYGTAKLANLAATIELAAHLEGTGARVVSVDPGLMRTGAGRDLPGFLGLFNRRLKPNQQPIDRTATAVLRAATDLAVPTGSLLDRKGRPLPLPRSIRDATVRRDAYDRTVGLLGLTPSR